MNKTVYIFYDIQISLVNLLVKDTCWWKSLYPLCYQWWEDETIIIYPYHFCSEALQWCHNGCNGFSNHQPHHCLLNRLFGRRSKKTSKPCVTGLCVGNSPVTGEFSTQMDSNTENVSIWWSHHGLPLTYCSAVPFIMQSTFNLGCMFCLSHCPTICKIMLCWTAL